MLRNVGFALCLLHFFFFKEAGWKAEDLMELYPVESFERSRDTGDLLDLSEAVWPLRVMLFESFDPIVSLFQGPK